MITQNAGTVPAYFLVRECVGIALCLALLGVTFPSNCTITHDNAGWPHFVLLTNIKLEKLVATMAVSTPTGPLSVAVSIATELLYSNGVCVCDSDAGITPNIINASSGVRITTSGFHISFELTVAR